jgi:hypothetical protein
MNQNNLTICYYEGYSEDINGIKVTIKSLKEFFDGQIIILYNNISKKILDFFLKEKITAIDCSGYSVIYKTSPYNNKIIYTFLYFRKNIEFLKEKNILFCDIGDFYFQMNPFDLLNDKITLGFETLKIAECPTNATWFKVCYGTEVLNELADKKVINSGFILGPFTEMYKLFELMLDDLTVILSRINYPTTDQTILNKLVYKDNFNVTFDEKNITNMAQKNDSNLKKINHQYNKIKDLSLAKRLYKKYE